MENADKLQDARWVDERMATLLPSNSWRPRRDWEPMYLKAVERHALARRRRMMAATAVVFAAIAVAFALPSIRNVSSRLQGHEATFDSLLIGERIPDFVLKAESGQWVHLSDYHGELILLNFWAPWCVPCADELPSLQALNQRLSGRRFRMMAVAIQDDPRSIEEFYAEHGLSIPLYFDPDGEMHGSSAIPETYLIDLQGILVKRYAGIQDWSSPEMIATIESLLDDLPALK